ISELQEKRNSLKAKWESEKQIVEGIQAEKKNIEQLKFEAEQAERQGDFGKVAEIRYGRIAEAEKRLKELEAQWQENASTASRMIKEEVDREDIAEVVAKWSGVPVTKMLQSEVDKL